MLATARTTVLSALCLGLLACAGTPEREEGFSTSTTDPTEPTPPGSNGFGNVPEVPSRTDDGVLNEVHEVYGHSATTLYRLDPKTKQVTLVGNFVGCDVGPRGGGLLDIALDEQSRIFGVSTDTLFAIDKTTAKCTVIGRGDYPTSLSFVPKGTLEEDREVLVGYVGGDYLRIDATDGSTRRIGSLGKKGYESSGDIVSVKGGKTFLTVKGNECSSQDCLFEVNPRTGAMVKNYGSIEHRDVFGLTFWAAKLYGFDREGALFEVTLGTSSFTTTAIKIPNKPSNLSFWGAGSSTSAPLEELPK